MDANVKVISEYETAELTMAMYRNMKAIQQYKAAADALMSQNAAIDKELMRRDAEQAAKTAAAERGN